MFFQGFWGDFQVFLGGFARWNVQKIESGFQGLRPDGAFLLVAGFTLEKTLTEIATAKC